jgi:hypothetical protein
MGSFFTSSLVSRTIVGMRLRFALVVLLAACGDDGSMLPVGGGGNDGGFGFPDSGGGSGTSDAKQDSGTPAPVDAALINGRVCLATDPRRLNECATTGAGGLTVRLGNETTTTNADGSFTITASSGTWRVTGANIVTSIMVLADYEIPAITRTSYDAMVAASLTPPMFNAGEGSVMIQLIRNGVGGGLQGTATSDPASTFFPRYDSDASPSLWATDMTHMAGTAWIPGIDVGMVNVSVDTAFSGVISDNGLPVVDGAITYTTIVIP